MSALAAALLEALDDATLDALAERLRPRLQLAITPPQTQWLNVTEAAEHLRCPKSRIYALNSAGRIPVHRDGALLLFDRDELNEWVRAGGATRPRTCGDTKFMIGSNPMPSTITTPVAGRIPNEHAHQLEALARRNGTTTSSIVAQIIAERLDTLQADHLANRFDDLHIDGDDRNTEQGVRAGSKVQDDRHVDRGGTASLPVSRKPQVDANGTGR
jgi:excisionase family DNA binding protein